MFDSGPCQALWRAALRSCCEGVDRRVPGITVEMDGDSSMGITGTAGITVTTTITGGDDPENNTEETARDGERESEEEVRGPVGQRWERCELRGGGVAVGVGAEEGCWAPGGPGQWGRVLRSHAWEVDVREERLCRGGWVCWFVRWVGVDTFFFTTTTTITTVYVFVFTGHWCVLG